MNAIVKDELDLSLDHWDNILLGCFLQALAYSQELNGQPIGVLVLTHGNAQASSMLDIAKRFLGPSRAYHGRALDMPWETPVGEILEQACSIFAKSIMARVLLMVDMGPPGLCGSDYQEDGHTHQDS